MPSSCLLISVDVSILYNPDRKISITRDKFELDFKLHKIQIQRTNYKISLGNLFQTIS